ncbi:MAG: peptidoglycan DD-metalloendopeptidase family protein [Shewanella sp.]|nr:peptidoglycan DD-metalloendopeptidase family protein [Shewanella sp.]MCF1429602.1 peptidoglycan DD-metalloendopeptidase family protein [Shewanella sp.]MCF1458381.1 peptidoglycan DD-metalloendopeptidase family protein [Shewanella sp.]
MNRLPLASKKVLLTSGLLVGAALMWPGQQDKVNIPVAVPLELNSVTEDTARLIDAISGKPDFEFVVEKGDTLSSLFQRAGVDQQTMYRVLEADLNILALDTLRPGNRLQFYLDKQNRLTRLELYFNPARQVEFILESDGSYRYRELIQEGYWRNREISGDIQGSFYLSAQRKGLTAAEIQRVEELLQDKLNFTRDLRAGDTFNVLLSEQFVDAEATGDTRVLAVQISNGNRQINAFMADDGQFYDEQGHSLARAFQRYPLEKKYPISSGFNPNRRHPVTGKVVPHNGTDFAVPSGTKILSPGDGVVRLVANHRFAGKYIVIEHGDKYSTRYLHLSKSLVKQGQKVSRGQLIALSGNTGRTTGPHLHYEFRINGRPVNAMTAKIPMAQSLVKDELDTFLAHVHSYKMQMGLV